MILVGFCDFVASVWNDYNVCKQWASMAAPLNLHLFAIVRSLSWQRMNGVRDGNNSCTYIVSCV